jgi:hypothetical protein
MEAPLTRVKSRYDWSERSMQYRDRRSGRFVPRAEIRDALDAAIESAQESARMIAIRMQDARATGEGAALQRWQHEAQQMARDAVLASIALERGGWAQMRPSDYGRAGRILREEYARLERLAEQIARRELPLDGRFIQRTTAAARACRRAYHASERASMIGKGFDRERYLLHAQDSCETGKGRIGCVERAAAGWRPIGELPGIGYARCGTNCKCSTSYSNSATGQTISGGR